MSRDQDAFFVEHPEGDARRRSAIRLAEAIVAADGVLLAHRRRALSNAVWWYTEADGKHRVRYRSLGAMAEADGARLQHEHVVTRKSLVDRMLQHPDQIASILGEAVACLVTKEEHRLLSAQPSGAEGWRRYELAGVHVIDTATGNVVV